MNKFFNSLFLILFLFVLTSCEDEVIENKEGIVINEICSNNASVLSVMDYEYYDWIELYNPTDEEINLKNYGISDNKDKRFKFTLPSLKIEAKGYVIIYFNPEGEDKANLIAGFGISAEGEEIFLSMPNGSIIDSLVVPSLNVDTTYGRYLEGNNYVMKVLNPSPNKANESVPIYKYISAPIFSETSGFYPEEFKLMLSTDENVDIYYTLDCTTPTKDSLKYNDPIQIYDTSSLPNTLKSRTDTSVRGTNVENPVDKGMVVRAIAISKDGNQSEVVTNTYFIDKENYKTKNKNVISLVTDPKNLIDGETGIYVKGKAYEDWYNAGAVGDAPEYNFEKHGRDWERECNLTVFDQGNYSFSQDCGFRIHGYGGRTYYIKSFNVYARSCYGEKYFKDPMLEKFNLTKSIVLKYDRYSSGSEKYRDGFLQSLMADTNVGTQEYEMCSLFLNGEFWHSYMIMEKYTDDSISEEYGVNKDDVVIIKEGSLDAGNKQDLDSYNELIQFAKTAKFEKDINYEKLCELIDVDSFIDFYSTQIYYNHFDFSYKKNVVVWKTRTVTDSKYGDGKWRWMLYDFDYAAVNTNVSKGDKKILYDYKTNTFTEEFLFATDFKDDALFHNFMKNEKFKERFIQRFYDLANTNFSSKNVGDKLYKEYNTKTASINTFFKNRFSYISDYFAEYLNISNEVKTVEVETSKNITFNSIELNSNFMGNYLKEFNIVVKVENGTLHTNDMSVVSQKNGVYTLKITGNNPKITIR